MTILLVDDNSDGRFFLERGLRKIFGDCAVVACASPHDAEAKLAAGPVDAIVTDHQLGPESGCDFIAQARRQGATCPIVMVTCSPDPRVADQAYRVGATKVFPADGNDFAVFLKTQLEGTQAASPPGSNPTTR